MPEANRAESTLRARLQQLALWAEHLVARSRAPVQKPQRAQPQRPASRQAGSSQLCLALRRARVGAALAPVQLAPSAHHAALP